MARALPQGFRRKKNGSIEYRFMIGEERFSVSGSSVKECRQKEREKAAKVAAGQYVRNSKVTVSEYVEEWLKTKKGTVKEATLFHERVQISPALDIIGGEKVSALERRRMIALQGELSKRLTTQGVNQSMMLMRSVLKSAVIDGIISKNPCDGIKGLKRTEPLARDTIHRALTLEEQKAFFEAAADSWNYELFCFLLTTGLRIGEASALYWSDIDFKKGIIRIRRTVTQTAEGFKIGETTKSKSGVRDIPLTEQVREILKRQRQKTADFFGSTTIGYVFLNMKQESVYRSSVNKDMEKICKKAGIERISVHAFRDTFATRAIESGMNPQTLKTILGHSSLAMTMDLYAHVLPNTKQEEMDRVRIII